jgi:hypothetical protein
MDLIHVMLQQASCILCRDPDHLPLRCEEVEKKTETSHRRHVEELMTKALIRECTKCRTELVKSDGCNKVRCRCGQYMCYVCRKPIEGNYKHFCQVILNLYFPLSLAVDLFHTLFFSCRFSIFLFIFFSCIANLNIRDHSLWSVDSMHATQGQLAPSATSAIFGNR